MAHTRLRTTAGCVTPELALTQAHWCATRLTHHGWRFREFGCDSSGRFCTALTPEGDSVRMTATECTDHHSLQDDLCAALTLLAQDTGRRPDPIAHLAMMLRLGVPITRRPANIHPWAIPGLGAQRSAAVRIGYWLGTILTDDYRWQIVDVDAEGFCAVTACQDDDTVQRYTASPPRRTTTATTSMKLASHLATLTDAERRSLIKLVTAHQRQSASAESLARPGR